tara:strand:+ start:3194 stop:3838 length:645 start_codon:yes stop_codon:yes gene_type:complete
MKKVNFFDLGMNRGAVCDFFMESCEQSNINIRVIGFEPMPRLFAKLTQKYKHNNKVEVLPYAISENRGESKIYSANCEGGHSLFNDHEAVINQNIDKKDCFSVQTIKFSQFIINNLDKYNIDNSINILKSNIEGAEYFLFNDIIDSNIYKKFQIFCGTPNEAFDVFKIKSLKNQAQNLIKKMNNSGINFKRYTSIYHEPCPRNFDIIKAIKEIL